MLEAVLDVVNVANAADVADVADVGFSFISAFSDIKSTVEFVVTNPKVLWSVFGFLYVYHKACLINVREEIIKEFDLEEEQSRELKTFIKEKTQKMENIFFHGLDKYKNENHEKGNKTVVINKGHDILENKSVSDTTRDFYQSFGKEAVLLGDRLYKKVLKKKNLVIDEKTREKFINDLADERETLITKTHKRAGYNDGLIEMEEKSLPFELFKTIVTDVVDHADLLEGIKSGNIDKVRKNFKVSPVSVIKIGGIIASRIGARRRQRKAKEAASNAK